MRKQFPNSGNMSLDVTDVWKKLNNVMYSDEIHDDYSKQYEYHNDASSDSGTETDDDDEVDENETSSSSNLNDRSDRELVRENKSLLEWQKNEEEPEELVDAMITRQTASVETIITSDEEASNIPSDSASSITTNDIDSLKSEEIRDCRSKIFDLLHFYPIPDDPGNIQAFTNLHEPKPYYPNDGVQMFLDLMKALKLKPINCMIDYLQSDAIKLRYYGVDPRAVKAICEATMNNTSVQAMDLKVLFVDRSSALANHAVINICCYEDNWLTLDACFHLNILLKENDILESLSLNGCKIGFDGIKMLISGLSASSSALLDLDLTGCRLGDEGFIALASFIGTNTILQKLNVRDNQIGKNSSNALEHMLIQNEALLHLNLSWNKLFPEESSSALFRGLVKNKTLLSIDLSWNGLNEECSSKLSDVLLRNCTLTRLDLSGNQFDGLVIAESLAKNIGLEEFHIGDNPLKPDAALALLRALTLEETSPENRIECLDLDNVWLNRKSLSVLEKLKIERPEIKVKFGGIFSNHKLREPDRRGIFLRRANYEAMKPRNKKQRRNFGHFILSLEDLPTAKENFIQLLRRFKLRLSDSLVTELINAFLDENKMVDQTAMKLFYLKEYPDVTPPPTRQMKKKETKTRTKLTNVMSKKRKNVKNQMKSRKLNELDTLESERKNQRNSKVGPVRASLSNTESEYPDLEDSEDNWYDNNIHGKFESHEESGSSMQNNQAK